MILTATLQIVDALYHFKTSSSFSSNETSWHPVQVRRWRPPRRKNIGASLPILGPRWYRDNTLSGKFYFRVYPRWENFLRENFFRQHDVFAGFFSYHRWLDLLPITLQIFSRHVIRFWNPPWLYSFVGDDSTRLPTIRRRLTNVRHVANR